MEATVTGACDASVPLSWAAARDGSDGDGAVIEGVEERVAVAVCCGGEMARSPSGEVAGTAWVM